MILQLPFQLLPTLLHPIPRPSSSPRNLLIPIMLPPTRCRFGLAVLLIRIVSRIISRPSKQLENLTQGVFGRGDGVVNQITDFGEQLFGAGGSLDPANTSFL